MRKFLSLFIQFTPTVFLVWILISPELASAAPINYVPLQPLPDQPAGNSDIKTYLIYAFKAGISVAGILSVLMLVIAGFQYATTDAAWGKEESKAKMTNVFAGLFLILVSYILLNTVNKDTVSLKLDFGVEEAEKRIGGGFRGGLATLRAQTALNTKLREAVALYSQRQEDIRKVDTEIGRIATEAQRIYDSAGQDGLTAADQDRYDALQALIAPLSQQKVVLSQQAEEGRLISAYQGTYDKAILDLSKNNITQEEYNSLRNNMGVAYENSNLLIERLRAAGTPESIKQAELLRARRDAEVDVYVRQKSIVDARNPAFNTAYINRYPIPTTGSRTFNGR